MRERTNVCSPAVQHRHRMDASSKPTAARMPRRRTSLDAVDAGARRGRTRRSDRRGPRRPQLREAWATPETSSSGVAREAARRARPPRVESASEGGAKSRCSARPSVVEVEPRRRTAQKNEAAAAATRSGRSARWRARAARRPIPRAEPVDIERVAHGSYVAGAVGNAPSLVAGRAAVTGTVVGEQPDPLRLGITKVRSSRAGWSRACRLNENGYSFRIATFADRQRAAVAV